MTETEYATRLAEIEGHGTSSDDDVAILLTCLGSCAKGVQRRAAQLLAACAGQHDRLVAMLQSAEARQRWGAAYALSLDGLPAVESVPVLIESLGSDDGDVRWAARDILMRLQAQTDVETLLLNIAESGCAAQRKMAAYTLRDLDRLSALAEPLALRLLEDPDAGVRIAAMSCVEKIAFDKGAAADAVARQVSHADAGVRRVAAATLGSIGAVTPLVRRVLQEAVNDPDVSLQRAARRSWAKLES